MFRRGWAFLRDGAGAVAPLVAVALIALVAMGGLAWDVSRAFALRGELDSAVDAAALAGGTQLDFGADAITRATAAAKGALVTNSQRLANTAESAVSVADADIKFLKALPSGVVGNYTTDPTLANYIEINLSPRQSGLVTGALAWTGVFQVKAHAVAGYGAAICMVPPLLICNPDEPSGNTNLNYAFDADAHIGQTLLLTPSGKNKPNDWAPGNFGFLDVGAVPDLKDAMARNTPLTQCFGSTVTSEPGNVTSVDQWFNTRFDIYRSGASGLSSDSLYSPAKVTIIGVKANAGACSPTPVTPPSDCTDHSASTTGYGFPLDCGQATNQSLGGGSWNWQKYFATNHPTATINPATFDWSSYGPNGAVSGQPTRYQVYKWEQALLDNTATGDADFTISGLGKPSPSGSGDWARPTCNTQTPQQSTTDRRTISAVMANCLANGLKGKGTVQTLTDIDLFLTAPVTQTDQTIYGEIVGKTSAAVGSTLGTPEKRYWVRLYE